MTTHRMNTCQAVPRPALSRSIVALLLLPPVTACDRPYDGPPVTEHDSAGVRIVEAHVPVWTDSTAWRLDEEPVLDLHALGPTDAYTFFRIRGMRRLGDGSIAVVNAGTGEIRLFSALGDHITSVGGQGEEPGEFGRLEGIELVGDSIFALDSDGDIAVFGPGPRPHPPPHDEPGLRRGPGASIPLTTARWSYRPSPRNPRLRPPASCELRARSSV